MALGVAKFILEGGSTVAKLGAMVRMGGFLQMVKNPTIPLVGASIPGLLYNWGAVKKDRTDNVFRKVARTTAAVVEKPGQLMEMTGEDLLKGNLKKQFTSQLAVAAKTAKVGGVALADRPFAQQAGKAVNQAQTKGLSFGRTLSATMGSWLESVNKQFDFTGKTNKKIAAKEAELAELRKGFSSLANEMSFADKAKKKFGKDVTLVSNDAIVKSLKSAPKRLDAAANRQFEADKLTKSTKRGVEENYMLKVKDGKPANTLDDKYRSTQDLNTTQAKIINKLTKDTASEGKLSNKAQHHVEKYANVHKDLNALKAKKNFWENPVDGLKQKAKNTTTADVVDFGVRYGTVAMQGMQNIRQTKIGMRTIKQLMADLQGTTPQKISTWRALFGKASPAVKEARKQFWKTMLPQNILFGVSTVFQEVGAQKVKRHFGSGSMWSSVGIPIAFQAIQKIGGLIGSGNTMLQNYADLRIAQEAGEQLDATNYATLLEAASKDIKAIGGQMSHNTVLIAQYYAVNQTPIADVMKDINAGKKTLMERSQQGQAAIKQIGLAKQAAMQVEEQQQAHHMTDTDSLVQGEGKFTSQERNQPAAQGGFADGIEASQEQGSTPQIG